MTDHPLVRLSTTCPCCDGPKAQHLVACWQCYRRGKNTMFFESTIDAREDILCRFELVED